MLFNDGLSYSSINTARSALTSTLPSIQKSMDFHLIVIRFRRGVLESHPAMARYTAVCDVNQVLDCLESLSPVCDNLF